MIRKTKIDHWRYGQNQLFVDVLAGGRLVCTASTK